MSEPTGSLGTAKLAKELAKELLANPEAHAPILRVVRGPALAPCVLPRPPSSVQLGRGDTATWRLDDPSVSREQCVVERTAAGTYVVDTSRRGTQVGGVVVTGRVGPLVSGQTISFGTVVLVYEEASLFGDGAATTVATATRTKPTTAIVAPATTGVLTPTPATPWWWWALMAMVLASLVWLLA